MDQTRNHSDGLFNEQTQIISKIQETEIDVRKEVFEVSIHLNFTKTITNGDFLALPNMDDERGAVFGNRSSKTVIMKKPNPRTISK